MNLQHNIQRFALGTAQMGMTYGIANNTGQISTHQAKHILNTAKKAGINTLDTAINYGQSSQTLGSLALKNWRIITKIPPLSATLPHIQNEIRQHIQQHLKQLQQHSVYAVLLHEPIQLLSPAGKQIWHTLNTLKQQGFIKKIGFSIYSPKELDQLIPDFNPDLIQAPFNIFDQRLKSSGWLKRLNRQHIEIHCRSVFLQGLLLIPADKRPTQFNPWQTIWDTWDQWLETQTQSAYELCLNYVYSHTEIDRMVIGVDNIKQLQKLIAYQAQPVQKTPQVFSSLDETLINPSLWPNA